MTPAPATIPRARDRSYLLEPLRDGCGCRIGGYRATVGGREQARRDDAPALAAWLLGDATGQAPSPELTQAWVDLHAARLARGCVVWAGDVRAWCEGRAACR